MRALSNLAFRGSGGSCRPRPARSPLPTSIPLREWARLRRVLLPTGFAGVLSFGRT
jgi:hypothetical protein